MQVIKDFLLSLALLTELVCVTITLNSGLDFYHHNGKLWVVGVCYSTIVFVNYMAPLPKNLIPLRHKWWMIPVQDCVVTMSVWILSNVLALSIQTYIR